MATLRESVSALDALRTQFGREPERQKLRRIAASESARTIPVPLLLAYHEALLFLRAYPDSPMVRVAADEALARIAERVARLPARQRRKLGETGVAGTTIEHVFSYEMSEWLARRFTGDVEIAWRSLTSEDRLAAALAWLAAYLENEGLDHAGLSVEQWFRSTRPKQPTAKTDLARLVQLFADAAIAPGARRDLFEQLDLPVRWTLRDARAARTLAAADVDELFCHREPLLGRPERPLDEIRRPLPRVQPEPRGRAESLIETARVALAARHRETYGITHANPDEVYLAPCGRGVHLLLAGVRPEARFPLDAVYGMMLLKNGVPAAYGGGDLLFDRCETGINVFETFRKGESALLFVQALRAFHALFGATRFAIDPYQIGADNSDAIRTGAFWFYYKLGFRPVERAPREEAAEQAAAIAQRPGHRTPPEVLRRFAKTPMALDLNSPDAPSAEMFPQGTLGLAVTRRIESDFDGDRRRATRAAVRQLERAVGRIAGGADVRRGVERLAPLLTLIDDLPRWPSADRKRLAQLAAAKGAAREREFAVMLARFARLRKSLLAAT